MTNTTKNLTWKLKDAPTATEVAELVDSGIITAEQAREIIFGAAESDKDKIETLQEINKFLQDVIKDLARNKTTIVQPITRTLEYTPRPYFHTTWANVSDNLTKSGISLSTGPLGETSMGSVNNGRFTSKTFNTMQVSMSKTNE